MHKLHYSIYIPPQVIKLKYFMNLRDKDNLRRKDKSSVPKVSFLRRFHCIYGGNRNVGVKEGATVNPRRMRGEGYGFAGIWYPQQGRI